MGDIDRIIDSAGEISLLAQLRDKVVVALNVDRRECGNCSHWMNSRECPREKNTNGRRSGPSMSSAACDKFSITAATVKLKAQRVKEALDFAEKYDLPTPLKLHSNIEA
jgi:hypothetical protein